MPAPTVAPLLNVYKQKFLFRRIIQNLLGGIIFSIESDDKIPCQVYLVQILLFVIPFLIGGIFILISDTNSLERRYASITAALIFLFYLIVMKLSLTFVSNRAYLNEHKKKEKKIPNDPTNSKFNNSQSKIIFKETNEFDSINFIFSSIPICVTKIDKKVKLDKWKLFNCILRIVVDSLIAGFIMFCGVHFESIVYLQTINFSVGGSVCVFIFNWIVLSLTLYALCIRAPAETAIYQPYDSLNIQYYTRAFYVICFQLVEIVYNFAPSNAQIPILAIFWLKIILNGLPIAWLLGILPPLDGVIFYFLEQCYIHLYGGSAASTNLR